MSEPAVALADMLEDALDDALDDDADTLLELASAVVELPDETSATPDTPPDSDAVWLSLLDELLDAIELLNALSKFCISSSRIVVSEARSLLVEDDVESAEALDAGDEDKDAAAADASDEGGLSVPLLIAVASWLSVMLPLPDVSMASNNASDCTLVVPGGAAASHSALVIVPSPLLSMLANIDDAMSDAVLDDAPDDVLDDDADTASVLELDAASHDVVAAALVPDSACKLNSKAIKSCPSWVTPVPDVEEDRASIRELLDVEVLLELDTLLDEVDVLELSAAAIAARRSFSMRCIIAKICDDCEVLDTEDIGRHSFSGGQRGCILPPRPFRNGRNRRPGRG